MGSRSGPVLFLVSASRLFLIVLLLAFTTPVAALPSPTANGEVWLLANGSATAGGHAWHSSVVFDNKMWMIGGLNATTGSGNDTWYSVDGTTWTLANAHAAFPARDSQTSLVFDNRMWVIGGENFTTVFNDTWYSTDGVTWTMATPAAAFPARWSPTSLVFDNRMWVIGGADTGDFNDTWYSADGITWTRATPAAAFPARDSHSSVVFDNRMWVIGGESGRALFNDVWYSTDGATWTLANANAAFSPRNGQSSLVFANKMWVIGGAPFPTGFTLSGIAKAEGSFSIANVIPSPFNEVWKSTDGIIWTPATGAAFAPEQPVGQSSVVFNNEMWVIEGESQAVWFSPLVNEAGFTGSPVSGTAPLTVQFTDTSVGTALGMWNWSFGDGTWFNTTDPSQRNVAHLYRTGTYDVSLTVNDDQMRIGSVGVAFFRPSSNTLTRTRYITAIEPLRDNSENGPPGAAPTVSPVPGQIIAVTTTPPAPGTGITVNVGGNSGVYRVVVTGTGHSGLIVTGTVASGPGQNTGPAPGTIFQYLDLTPARFTTIDGAVISFMVPLSWLSDHHVDPQNVVLYHLVGTTWTALPTTYVRNEGGQAYFTAPTPGFSRFAIAGQNLPVATMVQTTAPVSQTPEIPVAAEVTRAVSTTMKTPVAAQTTAVPALPAQPSPSLPLSTIGLGVVGCVVLVTGGILTRRWWIRKQNPVLFSKD